MKKKMTLEEMMAEEVEDIEKDIDLLNEVEYMLTESYRTAQYLCAVRAAKKALEKQKPKRVDFQGELKCPACGKYLTAMKCLLVVDYCFYCGQRVYVDIDLPEEETGGE